MSRVLAGVVRRGVQAWGLNGATPSDWPVMVFGRATAVRVLEYPERRGWWMTVTPVPGQPEGVEALLIQKGDLAAS